MRPVSQTTVFTSLAAAVGVGALFASRPVLANGPPALTPASELILPGGNQLGDGGPVVGHMPFSPPNVSPPNVFVIAYRNEATGRIMLNRLGVDGTVLGGATTVSTDCGWGPALDKTVALPLVAWSRTDCSAGGLDRIMIRILNNDGTVNPMNPDLVADAQGGSDVQLAQSALSGDTYLLTWSGISTYMARLVRVSSPGAPFINNPISIPNASEVRAVYDGANQRFIISYVFQSSLFVQAIDNAGALQGAPFRLADRTGLGVVRRPRIAYGPDVAAGRLMIVWQELNTSNTESSILGQRVNFDGTTLSNAGNLLTVAQGQNSLTLNAHPDISYSAALGQYIITWDALDRPPLVTNNVDARVVNADGTMPRDPFTVSIAPTANNTLNPGAHPVVAWSEPVLNIIPGTANVFEYIVAWRGPLTAGQGDVRYRFADRRLDTDGDALLDEWETGPADLNNDGIIDATNDVNLLTLEPANPPNPNRKDVYLELDWQSCAFGGGVAGGCPAGDTHSHQLLDLDGNAVPDIATNMINAFGQNHAPSNPRNPDGSNSVTLHFDYGQLGGGNVTVHTAGPPPTLLKLTNMARNRWRIFHYGAASHTQPGGNGGADIGGSSFWAANGGNERVPNDAIAIPANSFMHELGHNLGLLHGGNSFANFKPNYISVMNYAFSGGVPTAGFGGPGPLLLDFSNQTPALPALDETQLNESVGIGAVVNPNLMTFYTCLVNVGGMLVPQQQGPVSANASIDWNCNGTIDNVGVPVDVNNSGGALETQLDSFDDWSNLTYNLRASGSFGAAQAPPAEAGCRQTFSVVQNHYDGPQWWGTIAFKNNGPSSAANYEVEFDVPPGVHCTAEPDAVPPGATLSPLTGSNPPHTVSNHCIFRWVTGVPLLPGAIKTFNYSTDSQSFTSATNIKIRDRACSCMPEEDAVFCGRLGKNCGTVSGSDNCGFTRTVTSCGVCAAPATCGAIIPNVCGGALLPTADAYVRQGEPNTNFGTALSLLVKDQADNTTNTRKSFLKFDVSPFAGPLSNAKLRLFGGRTVGTTIDAAYAVPSNNWTELGITWNNKPAIGAKLSPNVTITTTQQWYEFDVTSFVQSQLAAGIKVISLAVIYQSQTSNAPDTFNSREAPADRPQLLIVP